MKLKRYLQFIKESLKEDLESGKIWEINEDQIREYLIELDDAGYLITVGFGFVDTITQHFYNKPSQQKEVYSEKAKAGENVRPAYWIQIEKSRDLSKDDVSDAFKFACSIISDEGDCDISIYDRDGGLGDVEGIQLKGGLFFTDNWNSNEPELLEADDYIAIFAKQKNTIKIRPTDLEDYYGWSVSVKKDGQLWAEMDLEDLADFILSPRTEYKDSLVKGQEHMWDYYDISDYYPDIISLFNYSVEKENQVLVVKAIIKELGGYEQAIFHYSEALKVYTFEAFPQQWAGTQDHLANAYCNRIRGDKAENQKKAIVCCQEALKVRTFNAFPQEWAATQNGLAIAYSNSASAYSNRMRGDKAENLEQAIFHYSEALKVRTFKEFPQDWAETQNNLANAYSDRMREDKAENLEKAISYYQEALKVYTFDDFPQQWATAQNNLALAYRDRIRGDKAENLEKAIASYHNALKIRTKESYPLNCLQTARNLANLHYDQKQWQQATEAYHTAIEAVENARLEALNPQSRQEVLSNAIGVFHRIVQAHLNLNQPEKALEYIERSKGRNLVELITQKNLHPQGVSQEIITQLNELKQRVVNEQIRLQHQSINQNLMSRDNLTPYVPDHSYLKEYKQDLDNFIAREIKDPLFSLTQKVEPIPFTEIQALTDAETCLLQWYITGEKILAFVVSAEGEVKYWQSSENDKNQLFDKINNYLQLYYSGNGKQEWRNQLSNLLQTFADILHINDILALIPDTCQRLIIIPHWFLHILPLHALPVDPPQLSLKRGESATGGSELQDLFPKGVQYAPSCQILQKISQTSHNSDFNKLFAIQNPTKDLFYTDLEVNILSTFFTEPQVIAKDNATKNAVLPHLKSSDNHCYHFSCHGGFNPANPLESALFLANKEPLTLGEIFELRLNKCRLVTLSACETGMIDINSISDEYIGLPSGFLFAGSPSVVSSLWTVNDLSTSFLMIKLYEILFDENQQVSVPVALKIAQNWLQNLTIEEFDRLLVKYKPEIDQVLIELTPNKKKIIEKQIELTGQRGKYPFANPYYWAAFLASGV